MSRVILKATDGMIYTNGESYGRLVYLGTGDNPDNWWEITEEEFEKRTADDAEEDIATEDDYRSALRELGVKV